MGDRIDIAKTYKLFIDGKFPRTESGRYIKLKNKKGELIANICRSSRKDLRNSVVAARKAQTSWSERSAYNIGQILYRIAENLESRKQELSLIIQKEGQTKEEAADQEVLNAIDALVYFAGWSDKFQAVFSSVNPVASSHFNFSVLEPKGVVTIVMDNNTTFSQFVTAMAASMVGGNASIIVPNLQTSLSAMTFAEVLQHSDVPAAVVNILTGDLHELKDHFSSHMDINALLYWGDDEELKSLIDLKSVDNLKRVIYWSPQEDQCSPYSIYDLMETKTTWHPIEQIGGSSSAY